VPADGFVAEHVSFPEEEYGRHVYVVSVGFALKSV